MPRSGSLAASRATKWCSSPFIVGIEIADADPFDAGRNHWLRPFEGEFAFLDDRAGFPRGIEEGLPRLLRRPCPVLRCDEGQNRPCAPFPRGPGEQDLAEVIDGPERAIVPRPHFDRERRECVHADMLAAVAAEQRPTSIFVSWVLAITRNWPTRSALKALKAASKPYYVWDAVQAGFGVRVRPTGTAAYVVMFRLRGDPKQHFVTLAPVAEMAPEEARARAAEIKVAAREGRNLDVETKEAGRSAEAERRQANDITVAELCECYLTHLAEEPSETYGRKRAASTVRISRVWLSNLIRLKGDVRLSVITDADLKDVVAAATIKSRRAHTGVIKRAFAYAAGGGAFEPADPATAFRSGQGRGQRARASRPAARCANCWQQAGVSPSPATGLKCSTT